MTRSHIIAAYRSPIAPRNGALATHLTHELAAPVLKRLLDQGAVAPNDVGELVLSNALGAGGNPARLAALAAGLPREVAGLSTDRQCAGGLDSILVGDALIRSGLQDVVIAGGAESYSRRPIRMHQYADGQPPQAYEQAPFTPWPDQDPDMAEAAQTLAAQLNIGKQQQDDWAIQSHARALAARDQLSHEIVPVAGLYTDSFARSLTPRLCARAKTVTGTITAANMAVAADGAAFVLMVSEQIARRWTGPSCVVLGGCTVGADPTQPGLAPIPAIHRALDAAQITPADLTKAEVMEAFAVQAIACQRGANLPDAIVNQNGGALARGHPIGASGAVLAVRLFHDLITDGAGTGLATIASAGGLGSALLIGV